MDEKRCAKCNIVKSASCFYRNKSKKGGLQEYCKSCSDEFIKSWRDKNPTKQKQIKKNWRSSHLEIERIHKRVNDHQELVKITAECACQSSKKLFHHSDYARPFEVEKLCPKCHAERHARANR